MEKDYRGRRQTGERVDVLVSSPLASSLIKD
jgi:hypothetical protein